MYMLKKIGGISAWSKYSGRCCGVNWVDRVRLWACGRRDRWSLDCAVGGDKCHSGFGTEFPIRSDMR